MCCTILVGGNIRRYQKAKTSNTNEDALIDNVLQEAIRSAGTHQYLCPVIAHAN